MKTIGIALLQGLIYYVFMYSLMYSFSFSFPDGNASAIGIIGGADGPTAIFWASPIAWASSILFQVIAVFVLCMLCNYIATMKKRGKKLYGWFVGISLILIAFHAFLLIRSTPFGLATVLFVWVLLLSGYLLNKAPTKG